MKRKYYLIINKPINTEERHLTSSAKVTLKPQDHFLFIRLMIFPHKTQ
jgi:hypothetical protein